MTYQNVPILMYHDVGDYNNPWCVSERDFAKQMAYLHNQGYQTISLDQLHKAIKNNEQTTKKYIVITFDDAREGVYTHGYSILKKYGFTATIYVVPGWTSGNNISESEAYSPFLSWNQLQELSQNGFTIGSHTNSHQDLTKLTPIALQEELELASKIIQIKLNLQVSHFCYPYGKFNEAVLKHITLNYKTAVTTQKGFAKTTNQYARQWILRDTNLKIFQKLLTKPTLAVCMIVKNEEKHLPSALNSIKNIADEIIIVDTGSTDNTKQIAAQFTNKIFDFTWQDDFSIARNEGLKHATANWLLILDADEEINPADHTQIQQSLNNPEIAGFRLFTRNYTNDSSLTNWQPSTNDPLAKSYQGWIPSLKIRLFQRNTAQFIGCMHEMVDEAQLQKHGKIATLSVPIHHYSAQDPQKQAKYLELTQKKLQDDPTNAKAYFELGIQYKNQQRFELAEQNLQKSLELDSSKLSTLLNLAVVQQKQDKTEKAIQNYSKIPNSAAAYFGLGFCYFKQNKLDLAINNFKKAIEYKHSFLDAYINLGAIYERQKNYQKAINSLQRALKINPQNARAHYNLGVVFEKIFNLPKAIASYEKTIELGYNRASELKLKIEKMKEFMKTCHS